MDTEIEKTMGILTDLLHARAYVENYPTDSDLKEAIKELREIVARVKAKNERIKELEEAMKPKTCEGCKFLNGVICKHDRGLYCVRQFEEDYFQPKDNA